ncbi:hypothetical protein [Larkinella terrae]|uniref:DUF2335 domain-containing protein n=1 Tax=Larkinella terrae TaxID=2025311 RepID=A0A7K0ENH1_9BACT|nr:hypothetical protein [Larkinella terrae]MRS63390.1 hypothetical protein [Larkinella terrae]
MSESEGSEKAKENFRKLIESSSTDPRNSGLSRNEFDQYDQEERRTRLLGLTQDIQERKKFAQRIFWMVVMWLFVILGIIIAEGLHLLDIPQAVTIALIGSTTINVTAFFVIVTKYLFPGK